MPSLDGERRNERLRASAVAMARQPGRHRRQIS
jgi:hypothetical protein